MVYKTNIPLGTDRIVKSRREFKENYAVMARTMEVDHVPLTEGDDNKRGKHAQMTIPVMAMDPATAANEANLYSKTDAAQDLYYNNSAVSGKIVSNHHIALGGIKLEAYCVFNTDDGTFLTAPFVELDYTGKQIVSKRDIKSPNVESVVVSGSKNEVFTINIGATTPLSTADYFYNIQTYRNSMNKNGNIPIITAQNNAAYGSTCTTTKLVLESRILNKSTSDTVAPQTKIPLVYVEIWTVS